MIRDRQDPDDILKPNKSSSVPRDGNLDRTNGRPWRHMGSVPVHRNHADLLTRVSRLPRFILDSIRATQNISSWSSPSRAEFLP